jgi:CheY-like chemotaxis protein
LEGKIEVKSELGKGSEFTLIIPLKTKFLSQYISHDYSSLTSTTANLKAEKLDNPNEKTILLVEDSEPAIIQLKYMLEAEGYNLEVAKDGGEAMKSLTSRLPDAMILDLMMPEIDGFDVIRLVRENEKTKLLPIIILTAKHIEKKDYDFFKTNNIIQLIQKGDVNKIELLNAVAKMLTSKIDIHEKPTIKFQKIEGKPLVLIVEDNPDNMITTKALIDEKFEILEALNGFEGVEQAIKYKPNLILMDIALPEMNGIEAFKRIRQNESTKDIPIVVLTASAMKGEKEKILSYGFDGYITKPIEEKIFFNTINQVLYGSK